MYILQPDINISLDRGGSWKTLPEYPTNSYFVDTSLNSYERASIQSTSNFRDSILVADWAAGAYVVDDLVRYGTSIFKCNTNTSAEPSKTLPIDWTWIAYSNYYNAFNGILESRSYGYTTTNGVFQDWEVNLRTSATTAVYNIEDGDSIYDSKSSRVNQLVIMNLFEVDTISVELKKSDNTTILFSESYGVSSYPLGGTVGWTSYYDQPKDSTSNTEIGRSLVVDIPSVGNGYLKITFSSSGTNKMRGVGGIFTGRTLKLGTAQWGSSFDITQFSKIESNDFGEYSFVERSYKNNFTYDVALDTNNINAVRQILLRNRAYPCVYIGDPDRQTTINYGVFSNISPSLQYGTTFSSLEIKGV